MAVSFDTVKQEAKIANKILLPLLHSQGCFVKKYGVTACRRTAATADGKEYLSDDVVRLMFGACKQPNQNYAINEEITTWRLFKSRLVDVDLGQADLGARDEILYIVVLFRYVYSSSSSSSSS